METVTDSLHQVLRARTHEAHVRLNRHPLLDGLTRPGYPIRRYWLVLSAYYHFYRSIEELIESASKQIQTAFDYTPRRKHAWLRQDLVNSFHIDPDEFFWRPSRELSPIRIDDQADLVGALYPIEGSTLGGQVISRHINAGLGFTPEHGGRFFHGYGEVTDSLWDEFLIFAEQACTDPAQREKAGQAALAVFTAVEALLDDYAARAESSLRPRA